MKCKKCNKEMELKDSYYEYWNEIYWEGYKCCCGNVELINYNKNAYIEKVKKHKKIKQYKYMQMCPECNITLFQNFTNDTYYCNKCKMRYTSEKLYEIKTGGLKI
jgi:hypothetical protein